MYKIIGADGKEYGPITANQLRQWIAQGRANATTKVRLETITEWQTLGSIPEFADALAQPPTLPNLPAATPPPAKTSGLAIASLILGFLGFCGLTALIGLILGIVALLQINKSEGRLKGQGLAIAGVIVSAVFLLLMVTMVPSALSKAKAKAQSITCLNNVRQINLALVIHAQANTNTCPPAATWCDSIQNNVISANAFRCKAADPTHRCHYAFNAKLDGLSMDEIKNPAQTVMVFETDGGWNISGGSESKPKKARHGRLVAVGFVDGHAEMVDESRLPQLQWEP
jgi:prepilin-type processing-associated H-X9-DG protein